MCCVCLVVCLHLDMQLMQKHLFQGLVFILLKWLDILVKNQLTINIKIYVFCIPFHWCICLTPESRCLKNYSNFLCIGFIFAWECMFGITCKCMRLSVYLHGGQKKCPTLWLCLSLSLNLEVGWGQQAPATFHFAPFTPNARVIDTGMTSPSHICGCGGIWTRVFMLYNRHY